MAISVRLRPEVEAWIQQEAARDGLTPGEAVSRVIEAQWTANRSPVPAREAELLAQVQETFDEGFGKRYRPLYRKLHDETLTEPERQEFLHLHTQVEAKNVERMTHLLQLAKLRGTTLPEIMRLLHVGPVQMPVEAA